MCTKKATSCTGSQLPLSGAKQHLARVCDGVFLGGATQRHCSWKTLCFLARNLCDITPMSWAQHIYCCVYIVDIYIYISKYVCIYQWVCFMLQFQVVTVRRLAREYNKGLEKARQKAIDYNNKLMQDLKDAGVKAKYLSSSFVPIPQACPENLDMKWVRRFLKAYQWKKVARNTAGQYLAS